MPKANSPTAHISSTFKPLLRSYVVIKKTLTVGEITSLLSLAYAKLEDK